ncbi:MAG: SCO family protein [Gammaproteobacteria bacterium]|nr:SCO family protein [Gammaproteobacteria bacterium]MDH5799974.1 SCO family protein [Gammaproteobacteria bacterium]
MHKSNWTILNRLLLSLVVVVAISWAWWNSPRPGPAFTPVGGDFTLHSSAGPVSLKNFRGKVVLMYFGFSHCPDICPTTLKTWAQALDSLDPAAQDRVQGLFISIDPQRDTLKWLEKFTHYFHSSILGLSGSQQELQQVADLYQVKYRVEYSQNRPDEVIKVEHTPFVYIINPHGGIHTLLPHDSSTAGVLNAVELALTLQDYSI